MSTQELVSQRKPWVLVSSLREGTNEQDIERIRPGISDLIDQWQSQGRMMWSGALNDNKTGIAIFEATDAEATQIYDKYDKICKDILDYYLYQWDAMPVLSFLEK
ncbi:MAG: group II intron reverse transcriptase/maturase [Nitrososphaerota archaeon]